MWTNRFIVGLKDEIQEFFVAHNPPTYASALWFDILMDMHCVKDKLIDTASSSPPFQVRRGKQIDMGIDMTGKLVDV